MSSATCGALSSETNYTTGAGPTSVAFSLNGSYCAVANDSSNTVSAYSVGMGGGLTAVTGSPFATGTQPFTVAFSPNVTLLLLMR
jgi:6-phosphogluconolactonase